MDLQIERAHRALGLAPREAVPPRSIIVKFLNYRTKEEILRIAWHKKGFIWKKAQIKLDNDYAPSVLKKRQEYTEAKKVLKENGIRFWTPFPGRLRVLYPDGTHIYNTTEEATKETVSGHCHGQSAAEKDRHRAVNNEGQHTNIGSRNSAGTQDKAE